MEERKKVRMRKSLYSCIFVINCRENREQLYKTRGSGWESLEYRAGMCSCCALRRPYIWKSQSRIQIYSQIYNVTFRCQSMKDSFRLPLSIWRNWLVHLTRRRNRYGCTHFRSFRGSSDVYLQGPLMIDFIKTSAAYSQLSPHSKKVHKGLHFFPLHWEEMELANMSVRKASRGLRANDVVLNLIWSWRIVHSSGILNVVLYFCEGYLQEFLSAVCTLSIVLDFAYFYRTEPKLSETIKCFFRSIYSQ